MSDRSQDQLTERYRRMLFAFPSGYRAEREEELIGVLLDSAADDGRTKPTMAERVDLVRAGLRTRLRGTGASPERRAWRDAAAVLAVLLVAMLAARAAGYLGAAADATSVLVGDEGWPGQRSWVLRRGIGAPFCLGWLAVVTALALRRVRVAAVLAAVATVADAGMYWWLQIAGRTDVNGIGTAPYWIALGVLVTSVLGGTERTRRGVELVGSRGVIGAFGVLSASWALRSLLFDRMPFAPRSFVLGLAIGAVLIRWRWLVGTMAGRRLIPLAAVVGSGLAMALGPAGVIDLLAVAAGLSVAACTVLASAIWRRATALDETSDPRLTV